MKLNKSLLIAVLSVFTASGLMAKENAKKEEIPGVAPQPAEFFYTGKPYDKDLGAYTFKYRNYDPVMSRWTSADPSGFPDGANNIIYVGNCVSMTMDPLGLVRYFGSSYVTAYNYFDNSPANSDTVASARNHGGGGLGSDSQRAYLGRNDFDHPTSLAVSPEANIANGSKVLIDGFGWFRVEDQTSSGLSNNPRFDMWIGLNNDVGAYTGWYNVTVFTPNETVSADYQSQGAGSSWNYSDWVSEERRAAIRDNTYWHGIYKENTYLE